MKLYTILCGVMGLLLAALFIGCSDDQSSPVQLGDKQEGGTNDQNGMQVEGYQSGTNNGFFWSLWTSDGLTGSVNYSNGSAGNYSVSWNCNGNFTCGKGWSNGSLTRIVGYNCGSYSQNGGGGSFAYYGWSRNPLREYYVNEMWRAGRPTGTSMGTINSDGGTYNLYRNQRVNAPSIDGTQTFWQIFSTRTSQNSTGQNHTITFANHANAWAGAGWGLGSDMSPAAILLTEAWGQSSGNSNATVWDGGSSGGSSSGGSSGGSSSGGGGSYNISVRARGTNGSEQIRLKVGGTTIATWTLTTSMVTRTASTSLSGGILVEFFNDASGRDVQVDYIQVPSGTWQAENQSYNTGVWQNNNCGGSNSEWLNCNGAIGFSAYR